MHGGGVGGISTLKGTPLQYLSNCKLWVRLETASQLRLELLLPVNARLLQGAESCLLWAALGPTVLVQKGLYVRCALGHTFCVTAKAPSALSSLAFCCDEATVGPS